MLADIVKAGSSLLSNLGSFGLNYGLNQLSWNREDNAVQRRVADLKAAGLSPVLAAGSSASSSPAIQVKSDDFNVLKNLQMSQAFAMQDLSIKKEQKELSLLDKQEQLLDNDIIHSEQATRANNIANDWSYLQMKNYEKDYNTGKWLNWIGSGLHGVGSVVNTYGSFRKFSK